MNAFYKTVDSADSWSFNEPKGLHRIKNRLNHGKMHVRQDVALQTAAVASMFYDSFYDLSLKLVGMPVTDRLKIPQNTFLLFAKALADIRLKNSFASHADIAKGLAPFDHPNKIFRVSLLDRGCFALLDCFCQLDTFVISVTNARDTAVISPRQAKTLMLQADELLDGVKKGLRTPKPASGQRL